MRGLPSIVANNLGKNPNPERVRQQLRSSASLATRPFITDNGRSASGGRQPVVAKAN